MALRFREGTINFTPPASGRRRRASTEGRLQRVNFGGTRVLSAQAMLKGYGISYNNGDHHVLNLEIDLDTRIVDSDGNGILDTVEVDADFVLRDSSGNIDDPYSGFVNFVVVADVA